MVLSYLNSMIEIRFAREGSDSWVSVLPASLTCVLELEYMRCGACIEGRGLHSDNCDSVAENYSLEPHILKPK